MKPLDPSDIHRLRAAEGWLELGDAAEAAAELESIPSDLRGHPAVLEMRWQVYAKQMRWDAARDVAQAIVAENPAEPSGWLHLSYSARRAKGGSVQAAWDVLSPIAKKFPDVYLIPYNLACYACQMGERDTARQWLEKALNIGKKDEIKLMALHDSDLEPLWKDIKEL